MSAVIEPPTAQPLTVKRVHTLSGAGHRNGSIYHIKGDRLHVTVQGNAFSSCGINLLFGLSGLQYTNLNLLDPLLNMLKNFEDTTPGLTGWKARRFLIQPTKQQVQDYPFISALMNNAVKIHEYNNLAHSSSKQLLYMLSFKD